MLAEHVVSQPPSFRYLRADVTQAFRDERRKRIVTQQDHAAAVHGDPRVVELLYGHGTKKGEDVNVWVTLVGSGHGDIARAACLQVDVRAPELPALVHERDDRERLHAR